MLEHRTKADNKMRLRHPLFFGLQHYSHIIFCVLKCSAKCDFRSFWNFPTLCHYVILDTNTHHILVRARLQCLPVNHSKLNKCLIIPSIPTPHVTQFTQGCNNCVIVHLSPKSVNIHLERAQKRSAFWNWRKKEHRRSIASFDRALLDTSAPHNHH